MVDEGATVGWRDVFAVVRASAERRPGRQLLVAYVVLAIFGLAVVAACVVVMHF
jgi:hypothetical protein